MEVIVKKAIPSMIDDIVKLDESVIGSQSRECVIRHAVESGRCYIVNTGPNIAAYGIMDYNFYEKGFISLLIVDQKLRRKGFGKLLVKTFIDQCKSDKLFTSTNRSNLPMQKFLENCGFKRCGIIDELDEGDPEIIYCYNKKSAASYLNKEDVEK